MPIGSKATLPDIDDERRRVLYGRRSAGRLRPYRKSLIEDLLPKIAVKLPADSGFDPKTAFDTDVAQVWLEIGFGGGEHLSAQAATHPEFGMIGVEPFVTGVARMLAEIDRHALHNVRLLVDDARLLLSQLNAASLDRIIVLFPDPWPKTRHHKRRIVIPDTLADMARALKPGGLLRIATDHRDYGQWILEHALREPALEWQARAARDWLERPADQVATKYEGKALKAGRPPVYFTFRKIDVTGFACEL